MTTIELARHDTAERGLNTADITLLQLFTRRTGALPPLAEKARHAPERQRLETWAV